MILLAIIRHGFSIEVPNRSADRHDDALAYKDLGTSEEVYIGDSTDFDIVYSDDEDPRLILDSVELDSSLDREVEDMQTDEAVQAPAEEVLIAENANDGDSALAQDLVGEDGEARPTRSASRTSTRKTKVRGVWSFDQCFPDINDVQLVAARNNGVRPVSSRAEADKLVREHKLVNITHSPYYTVDDLTHSIPYLVPKAQHLVNTICANFIDSLTAHGMKPCLPMITSALRTTDDVSQLQRRNGNATTNSCHCYGTTVDITYVRFAPIIGQYNRTSDLVRWDFTYKQVLSEVLDDLRRQGKCYVKYERKQGCYHLTVR